MKIFQRNHFKDWQCLLLPVSTPFAGLWSDVLKLISFRSARLSQVRFAFTDCLGGGGGLRPKELSHPFAQKEEANRRDKKRLVWLLCTL